MEDMGLTGKLFETSLKFQLASMWLQKISAGESADEEGKNILSWIGVLLREIDWSSNIPTRTSVGGGLSVQATTVRPTFYSSLIRIAPKFKEAGFTTERDILNFLSNLYYNLLSHGTPGRGHKKLNSSESELGVLLLQEISESILIQLNNNGLPWTSKSLKDEWEPLKNELYTFTA